MSIICIKKGVYVLRDSLVGDIAVGTKNEMKRLMANILSCGQELRVWEVN